MNRFSKDLGAIDQLLPPCLFDFIVICGMVLGAFCTAIYFQPVLLLPTLIVWAIFYNLRQYYLKSANQIKMMEGTSKAPIFSQLSSTLDGLSTVRALNGENNLIEEFDNKQDVHSSIFYTFHSSMRWFQIGLDFIGLAFLAICVLNFLFINGK